MPVSTVIRRGLLAAALCCAVAATASTSASAQADPVSRLSGVWVLNREKGTPPGGMGGPDRGRPGEGEGRRRPGGPGGRGPGGGPPGGGRGGGFGGGPGGRGPGGPDAGVDRRDRMGAAGSFIRSLATPSARLTIVAETAAVTLTDLEGRSQTIRTDGHAVEEKAENGLVTLQRKARWDGGALAVTLAIKDGPKVERRYELSEGGTELRITTAIEGRGGNDAGRRPMVAVYERAEE